MWEIHEPFSNEIATGITKILIIDQGIKPASYVSLIFNPGSL